MPSYNLVTNEKTIKFFKSRTSYFKTDLGQSITLDGKSGEKGLNTNDKFSYFYGKRYSTSIFSKGLIGNIKVYSDFQIEDDVFAFYWDEDEHIFNLNHALINEKGLDFFLGSILKEVHEKQEIKKEQLEKEKENQKTKLQPDQRIGDPSKVITSPGDVRYEDMIAYLEKQRQERLKV